MKHQRYAAAVMARRRNDDGHVVLRIYATVVDLIDPEHSPIELAVQASQLGPFAPEQGWFDHSAVVAPIEEITT